MTLAGKLHKSQPNYAASNGRTIAPGQRLARAYAEGYQARRNLKAQNTNPHPVWQSTGTEWIVSDWGAWDHGWVDAAAFLPATHVGKPDCAV